MKTEPTRASEEGGVAGGAVLESVGARQGAGTRPGAVEPWPEAVEGKELLETLAQVLRRFAVLPKWAAETLALWSVHTYAFQLRDVTTYIAIESPEKRCGKTTVLGLLKELANRAVASSNISPPAFFRVIEELAPTLLIDEVDTFLSGNEQLRGILNAGYDRRTAFVYRAVATGPASVESGGSSEAQAEVKRYCTWCPKALAKIGRFPDTLADRCIVIRMHRKMAQEQCERVRGLDGLPLRQRCVRFVADHEREIVSARPEIPASLNDRAADIWEPLLVLADIAGGEWRRMAREAAVGLSANAQESNPIGTLLFDIFVLFTLEKAGRLTTQKIIEGLNGFGSRPWKQLIRKRQASDLWLAEQLRPYDIRPKNLRVGDKIRKGYVYEDFLGVFRRYVPMAELDAMGEVEEERPPEGNGMCGQSAGQAEGLESTTDQQRAL